MHLAIEMFAGCTLHHGIRCENHCNQFARECVVPGVDGSFLAWTRTACKQYRLLCILSRCFMYGRVVPKVVNISTLFMDTEALQASQESWKGMEVIKKTTSNRGTNLCVTPAQERKISNMQLGAVQSAQIALSCWYPKLGVASQISTKTHIRSEDAKCCAQCCHFLQLARRRCSE